MKYSFLSIFHIRFALAKQRQLFFLLKLLSDVINYDVITLNPTFPG